jgi:hypothetical protein
MGPLNNNDSVSVAYAERRHRQWKEQNEFSFAVLNFSALCLRSKTMAVRYAVPSPKP